MALDSQRIVELLEEYLLDGEPTLTGREVADAVGIPLEIAQMRWRSLGFTAVDDDAVVFTEADVEALRLTQRLHEAGLADAENESALIRTLGRSFARLAEWQLNLVAGMIDPEITDEEELAALAAEILPVAEHLQNYVWRRHTIGAAARLLLRPDAEVEGDEQHHAIGFADIVGYTRQSRSLRQEDLARLVDVFEGQALSIIAENGGRIIKTIGDEVLFAVDSPSQIAEIALLLVEGHGVDEAFPELRVGAAWGPVLNRLGDVFGPTVNIASRLTSIARPGKVLVDKELADALHDDDRFVVRRARRTSVKGYRRLEPWRLRRARDDDELPPAAAYLQQKGEDLRRAVDEVQSRLEGPPLGKGEQELPGGQPPRPVLPPDHHHR